MPQMTSSRASSADRAERPADPAERVRRCSRRGHDEGRCRGRQNGRVQRSRWTEKRIARDLEAWFAQRAFERWPTYRTFVDDGRRPLYQAALRTGGVAR